MVMAESNQITSDGLPVLFVQDAPPQIKTPSLKLTRPGDLLRRSGSRAGLRPHGTDRSSTIHPAPTTSSRATTGTGGFPISSLPMRLAAAVSRGNYNILLTCYLTPESRMMIRRNVRQRLATLANFIHWDADPYLVLTEAGRLVWTVDGYTTSTAHPYSSSHQHRRNRQGSTTSGTRSRPPWTPTTARSDSTSSTRRPDHPGLPANLPAAAPAGLGNAGRSEGARALPGDLLPRAGRDLPDLPHARPAGLL